MMIWGILLIAAIAILWAFILWAFTYGIRENIRQLQQHREDIGRDYVQRSQRPKG